MKHTDFWFRKTASGAITSCNLQERDCRVLNLSVINCVLKVFVDQVLPAEKMSLCLGFLWKFNADSTVPTAVGINKSYISMYLLIQRHGKRSVGNPQNDDLWSDRSWLRIAKYWSNWRIVNLKYTVTLIFSYLSSRVWVQKTGKETSDPTNPTWLMGAQGQSCFGMKRPIQPDTMGL